MRTLVGLFALAAAASAGPIDTVIVTDGGPGPYSLGNRFVDTTTLRIVPLDTDITLPAYRCLPDSAAIIFESAPDSGTEIRITFEVDFVALPRTLRLYEMRLVDTSVHADTTGAGVGVSGHDAARAGRASERIEVSGFKSVGVSLGASGNASIEQALDITLTGRLGRATEISGHLSDQNSSLEGSTRELSAIDLIYLTLKNPRYQITVGDQYMVWPSGGLVAENKKIKGVSAAITTKPFSMRVFGAIAGGKSTQQTIIGQDGRQGPYMLTGNGEADLITPVGGTVHVTLDGKQLTEGEQADYTVDYDYGSITFSPRQMITAQSIIRVEYEYKTFAYERTLVGGDVHAALGDSVLTVTGALWNEADSKSDPIDISLSADDIRQLKQTGDSSIQRLVGAPIDNRDVPEYSAHYPLYALLDSAGVSFYRYVPFNPAAPIPPQTLYWVRFRHVNQGSGDYVVDTVDYRGEIYRYVGPGAGSVSAANPLPLPQRTTTGEMRTRLRPCSWLDLNVDIAGQSHDGNLFSSRDDNHNNGAATVTSLLIGRKTLDRAGLWLGATHRLITRDYTSEVLSTYETANLWHDSTFGHAQAMRQSWESSGGFTIGRPLWVEIGYGQLRTDHDISAGRLSAEARSALGTHLQLSYQGSYLTHPGDSLDRSRREQAGTSLAFGRSEWSLGAFDEWWRSDRFGVGKAGATATFLLRRPELHENLTYTEYGPGTGPLYTMHDTLRTLDWQQSIDAAPRTFWHVKLTSLWRERWYTDSGTNASTVLITAANDLSVPRSGLTTHLDYRLSSERAAALVQVPTYAGKGLGAYSYDSTRGELVPDVNGSFTVTSQEVYDNSNNNTVRRSKLDGTWSFKPRRHVAGILGDLRWSGELCLVEDVIPDSTNTSLSWLPGYLTLAHRDSAAVRLANCYYEQRIAWDPDSMKAYRGDLRVRPYARVTTNGREDGVEGRASLQRSKDPWFVGATFDGDRFTHSSIAATFDVTDLGLEFTEKYLFYQGLRAYVAETGGWGEKQTDNGWYVVVKPGLNWQPVDKGWADLSYSFAYVGIPGQLDHAMARGFEGGTTHRIEAHADVRMGEHFGLSGQYRGDFVKPLGAASFQKPDQVLSLEVKAYL